MKVLIIEDDNLLLKVYQQVLESNGFEVTTAATGPMGFELLKSMKPDIVLLDVLIPGGMTGFDILQKVKNAPEISDIPIIVISNIDTEKQRALQLGAVDYIFKVNTSIDEVVTMVKKYTEGNDKSTANDTKEESAS